MTYLYLWLVFGYMFELTKHSRCTADQSTKTTTYLKQKQNQKLIVNFFYFKQNIHSIYCDKLSFSYIY